MNGVLIVHHLGRSQSERIIWLCEELGLDYQLRRYDRAPMAAPPDYKALHPFGTAPVIEEDGRMLGETGAIVDYLIARHGNGQLALDPEHPDFADYLYWLHFANGSFVPASMMAIAPMMLGVPADSDAAQMLRGRLVRSYEIAEARLADVPWFAGADFTAADIMMTYPLSSMRRGVAVDLAPYPNIRAYLARIGDRPAFCRAMAKADPDLERLLA